MVGLLVANATASARTFAPPEGTIYSGAAVEWPPSNAAAFAEMTGQPGLAIFHRYSSWLESMEAMLDDSRGVDAAVMVSWRPMASSKSAPGGTLDSIVRGDIDGYIVASARSVSDYPRPVFLRTFWEMNGDWFPWSAYVDGGTNSGNSAALFRKAWARMHIIFSGGSRAQVNARLAAAGLSALEASGSSFPDANANAAWVWSLTKGYAKPRGAIKNVDYYPGDGYVDWIGLTFHQYEDRPVSYWASEIQNSTDPLARADDLYDFGVSRGKPFMLGEWGVTEKPDGNGDDPKWINDMLSWAEARPLVKAQVYFEREHGSKSHRLADHPKARAAFRARVGKWPYIHDWRVMLQDHSTAVVPGAAGSGPAPGAPGVGALAPGVAAAGGAQGLTGTGGPTGHFVGVTGRGAPAPAVDGPAKPDPGGPGGSTIDCGRVGPLDLRVAVTRRVRSEASVCAGGRPVSMTVAVNRSRVQGVIRTSHRTTRLTATIGRRSLKVRRAGARTWRFTTRRPSPGQFRLVVRQRGAESAPVALRVNARRAVSARLNVTATAKVVAMSSRLARHRVSVRAGAGSAGLVRGTVKLGGAAVRGATVRVVPASSVRRANARKWSFRGASPIAGLSVGNGPRG